MTYCIILYSHGNERNKFFTPRYLTDVSMGKKGLGSTNTFFYLGCFSMTVLVFMIAYKSMQYLDKISEGRQNITNSPNIITKSHVTSS